MLFHRKMIWGRLAAFCILAMTAVACQADPPELPDPDAELPAVDCGEDAPLSITRLTADSQLIWPPWMQVCTLCPSSSIALRLGDSEGGDLELVSAWSEGRRCAVALSSTPPPLEGSLPAVATVANASREGNWDFELPLAPGRATAPTDLGSGTYRLQGASANLRVPSYPWDARDSEARWKPASFLLHLGPADADGSRPLELGRVAGDSDAQDLCSPTSQLALPAAEVEGQLAAALSTGDRVPTRFGDRVHRGALQARLRPDGAQLSDVAVLAVINIDPEEEGEGGPESDAETLCATWEDELGFNPCTPCEAPDAEVQGPDHCVTTLSEWSIAPRTDATLVSISPDEISDDCSQEPESDTRTDNREKP